MNPAAFRFRPVNRLLLGKEYTAVFTHRRVLRNGPFELYYKPHYSPVTDPALSPQCSAQNAVPASMQTRLGLVVPKRNAKRAVHRNLIKRLAREAFRHVCSTLPACDLVLRLGRPLQPLPDGVCRNERAIWRTQIDELFLRLPRND